MTSTSLDTNSPIYSNVIFGISLACQYSFIFLFLIFLWYFVFSMSITKGILLNSIPMHSLIHSHFILIAFHLSFYILFTSFSLVFFLFPPSYLLPWLNFLNISTFQSNFPQIHLVSIHSSFFKYCTYPPLLYHLITLHVLL